MPDGLVPESACKVYALDERVRGNDGQTRPRRPPSGGIVSDTDQNLAICGRFA